MTAYDHVLKGLEHHRRSGITCEEAEKGLENFKKAIESILTMQGHMPGEHAHFPEMSVGNQRISLRTGLMIVMLQQIRLWK